MSDRNRAIAVTMLGAAVGACAGYLLFTEKGRTLRRQLGPAVEDLVRDLSDARAAILETASIASGGWNVLVDLLGDPRRARWHTWRRETTERTAS